MGISDGLLRVAGKWGWLGRGATPGRKLPWGHMSARLVRNSHSHVWEQASPVFNYSGIDLSGAEPESMQTMLEVMRTGETFASPPASGGSSQLREAVCRHILNDRKMQVDPLSQLVVTEGATGGIRLIAEAFVNRGDSIVLMDPGSPMHRSIMEFRGGSVRTVAARVNLSGFHEVNLGAFTAAIHGARILVLSQPNNPDGGMWHPERLAEIQWWANRRDLLVVVDETYASYLPEEQQKSLAAEPGWGQRILTVGSLSKSHAATGARVGWVHGHSSLIAAVQKVMEMQGQGIAWPVEKAAMRLLGSPGVVPLIRKRINDHRAWAMQKLSGFGMTPIPSRAGFFLWFPTWNLQPSSRDLIETLWQDCQVRLSPGETFGGLSQGHVRINLAGDPGRFQEGMNRLEKWAEGKSNRDFGDSNGISRFAAIKRAA